MTEALRRVRGLLIDLDGVIYIGNRPIPGAVEFFTLLRRHRMPFLLITNNSTQTPAQYVKKLWRMGISITEQEVLTSAQATAAYLARVAPPGASVFLIGEQGLREALIQHGFRPQERRAPFVVVGLDRGFNYEKLTIAVRSVLAGATLIGANPDVTLPSEEGDLPGAGSLLAAISAATGVSPIIVGKPERAMLEQAAQHLGLEPTEVGVVGDRLDTDILGAERAHMVSILVLTGVTRRTDLTPQHPQPDLVVENLPTLAAMLFPGPTD